ncbi:MAG: hypothetical protein ACHP6I_00210 [Rickettsiales bacterium]
MRKVFLISAALLVTQVPSVHAAPPVDEPRAQVAQDTTSNTPKPAAPLKSAKVQHHHEEIPDSVRQELQTYNEKKKALREALSPEAKAALKKRWERRKDKRDEVEEKKPTPPSDKK